MSKKVMVTGVAGLIGSHLVERLLDLGHEVHGLDTVELEGNPNLVNARLSENFKYYKGDIRSTRDIEEFFSQTRLWFITLRRL